MDLVSCSRLTVPAWPGLSHPENAKFIFGEGRDGEEIFPPNKGTHTSLIDEIVIILTVYVSYLSPTRGSILNFGERLKKTKSAANVVSACSRIFCGLSTKECSFKYCAHIITIVRLQFAILLLAIY